MAPATRHSSDPGKILAELNSETGFVDFYSSIISTSLLRPQLKKYARVRDIAQFMN